MDEPYVGAKVVIRKTSVFYGTSRNNPEDTTGVVIAVTEKPTKSSLGWWRVRWANGLSNDYRAQDLKILGEVVNG